MSRRPPRPVCAYPGCHTKVATLASVLCPFHKHRVERETFKVRLGRKPRSKVLAAVAAEMPGLADPNAPSEAEVEARNAKVRALVAEANRQRQAQHDSCAWRM